MFLQVPALLAYVSTLFIPGLRSRVHIPNAGSIQMLPATSSSLVVSSVFRYSRSSFSSFWVAHGKAILNIPVAEQKPSELRRIKKYVSGVAWFACVAKISEPFRSPGSGARRWAYSKSPRFSGLVAFDVPICPGLTASLVFPSRLRDSRSSTTVSRQRFGHMRKVA